MQPTSSLLVRTRNSLELLDSSSGSVCQYKTNPTTSDITVFVGANSACVGQNASITRAQSSITVTGLLPGSTYFLKINCTDECCANYSTSPEPVTNLSVHSITVSSVNLSWTPPNGISQYYRVAWGVNLLTTNQTSMQISQLVPGTKYTFRITSVASDNRTEGRATAISQNTRPAQVENITVLNSSNSSLTVGWTVPLGHVDSYIVNISGAKLKTFLINTSSPNSSVISNLTAGCVYKLTVITVSGVLKNSSNIVLVATKPNPPDAVRVSGQTDVSISLAWSKPLSMDGLNVSYEVSYRPNKSGSHWQ
ncbi:hypothetical protein Q8A67_000101 [Cirrhinus molitorella]|uniref:Fibronectin type-III domain-containing protein n=1 Tax=Cirrhinus molitorella TaxID=172907 RepID=A0AA88TWJ2_9TELE|nr:hypothetical protein Q8A67_000101 [Cirrhinus molitorella]